MKLRKLQAQSSQRCPVTSPRVSRVRRQREGKENRPAERCEEIGSCSHPKKKKRAKVCLAGPPLLIFGLRHSGVSSSRSDLARLRRGTGQERKAAPPKRTAARLPRPPKKKTPRVRAQHQARAPGERRNLSGCLNWGGKRRFCSSSRSFGARLGVPSAPPRRLGLTEQEQCQGVAWCPAPSSCC